VLEKVVQGSLLLIKAHRARDTMDNALLLSLVRMLRDLGLYSRHFQGPFLAASESAYAAEGLVLAGNSSVADALEEAERRLDEEAPLCREYLDPSTLEPALAVVKKQLLEHHFEGYLTRGLGSLLQESRLSDLARFLRLARAAFIHACEANA
jgi:cullin 4